MSGETRVRTIFLGCFHRAVRDARDVQQAMERAENDPLVPPEETVRILVSIGDR
ncbi:MAG: hypothetical protein ACLFPN_03935 [Methanomassiliicoccales archaeon]